MTAHLNETVVPAPLFISSRLMAALKIDGAGVLHVEVHGYTEDNRVEYRYVIEDADGTELEVAAELRSGVGAPVDYREIMSTLLSFLSAAAEASEDSENSTLFTPPVMAWAAQHSDELSIMAVELDEDLQD